ncbi:MAG: DUF805 domain-containing protein [Endomicrobium sp.]|jgi:uncharacterized membrane protein YhaH (DUF805 family)|nr:DUF805 domain-containing protein [Endomicrobium sp.]
MDKFMEWFKVYFWSVVTKQYANFSGRATREQFWYFVLVSFAISTVLGIISGGILSFLVSLILLLPSLGITARRLHDINQSGWLQLVAVIPALGLLVLIVLCALPPAEPNKYGSTAALKEEKVVETTSSEVK